MATLVSTFYGTRELTHNGLRLPTGSRIHLAAWTIGHDANRHAEAGRFRPEQCEEDLTTSEQRRNSANAKNPDQYAFGSGQRNISSNTFQNVHLQSQSCEWRRLPEIKPATNASLPLDPSEYPGGLQGKSV